MNISKPHPYQKPHQFKGIGPRTNEFMIIDEVYENVQSNDDLNNLRRRK